MTRSASDDGYAIRNMGASTAFAYDWLYDKLTPAQRAHARARWKAWLDAWLAKGYRAHAPAVELSRRATCSASTADRDRRGRRGRRGRRRAVARVADECGARRCAGALAPTACSQGGDWPEGWQYGPLSVARVRARRRARCAAPASTCPASRKLAGRGAAAPRLRAVAGGGRRSPAATPTSRARTCRRTCSRSTRSRSATRAPDDKRWARGELVAHEARRSGYLLYDALAGVGDKPVLAPRDSWPTWYVATGTRHLYARTRWDDRAVWFVAECAPRSTSITAIRDAGNFVLSRGKDDVDRRSVAVRHAVDADEQRADRARRRSCRRTTCRARASGAADRLGLRDADARAASSRRAATTAISTSSRTAERRAGGAARPRAAAERATARRRCVIVFDRAKTGGADRGMYLRFRTTGQARARGGADRATATVGGTKLAIASLARTSGTPAIATPSDKDCYKQDGARQCDAARFPVTEYRSSSPAARRARSTR